MAGPGVPPVPGQRVVQALGEQGAVGETGERVVQGAVAELGLQELAVRDVLDVHDQMSGPVRRGGHA